MILTLKEVELMLKSKFKEEELFSENNAENTGKLKPYADARIIMLTFNRAKQLKLQFKSLIDAHYGVGDFTDRVDMDIWIDAQPDGGVDSSVEEVADSFDWPYGVKTVHKRRQNVGLQTQWLYTWDTQILIDEDRDEIPIFLEDDITVSPWFYIWLKAAHQLYGPRPEIAGISLQRVTLCAKYHCPNLQGGPFDEDTGVLQYPLVGSWGYSPVLHHWYQFQNWFKRSRVIEGNIDAAISGLMPSGWYTNEVRSGKCPGIRCIWTMFHIYHTYLNIGHFTVYYKAPNQRTLGSNSQAAGLHNDGDKGKDFDFIAENEKPDTLLEFPLMPYSVNYHGKLSSHTFESAIPTA